MLGKGLSLFNELLADKISCLDLLPLFLKIANLIIEFCSGDLSLFIVLLMIC